MPFQSEKQRRYLHANHPEIAKRWEREYATGGISNHFRKRFFKGAQADTSGPAGGQAMSPGTSTTGGSRNIGGGQGNQGNQNDGGGPKPHSGPTLAEIEAQKKAAAAAEEARLQALEDARRQQMYDMTMAKRAKNIKHKKKIDTMGFDESQKFWKGLNTFAPNYYANLANQKKIKSGELDMGFNESQKFWKGLNTFAPKYYENLAKVKEYNKNPSMDASTGQWYDADGNPIDDPNINPEFASMIKPIAAVKEDFIKKQSWYNSPLTLKQNTISTALSEDGMEKIQAFKDLKSKIGSGVLTVEKYLNLSKAGKIPSIIAEDLNEQVLEAIEKGGGFGETFQKDWSSGVVEPTFKDGVLDIDVEELNPSEMVKPPKHYLEVAKGGVARKNYFHGGILDINESEEIISDDGNDIELTAYNAEFDDPKDLSTGVKTLFQAKDGGRIGFANGPPGGGDPGMYSAPSSDRGPRDAPDRHGPAPKSSPVGDYKGQHDWSVGTKPGEGEVVIDIGSQKEEPYVMVGGQKVHQSLWGTSADPREKYDSEEQMLDLTYAFNPTGATKKHTYITNKKKAAYEKSLADQKAKLKKMGMGKLIKALALLLVGMPPEMVMKQVMISPNEIKTLIEDSIPVMQAKKDYTTALGNAKADYETLGMAKFHHAVDTEIQTIDQTLLDLTKPKDKEEKGDGPEPPVVIPVKEEIDAYAQSDYYMSPWERIKANQAKRAMLVEKGVIQENPVVDESVTDIVMEANRGGLANLFRVKNQ